MQRIRVGSFFSGLGAFEKALERLGIPHEIAFYCEIDKYASQSFSLIHSVPESLNLWDITKVDETKLPDFDLMTWGFPCQDISVAGKQAGVIEGETRSGLYYDGIRILRHKKPKYSIIENVKNLTSKAFRPVFYQILCDLEDAGYKSYWQVLNAKDYGVPQNRERVFIVSIRNDIKQDFDFPIGFDNGIRLKDLLEDEVDEKYYISREKTEKLIEQLRAGEKMNTNPSGHGMNGNVYIGDISPTITTNKGEGLKVAIPIDKSFNNPKPIEYANCITAREDRGISNHKAEVTAVVIPVLTPDREEKRKNGRRFKDDGEPMFTLTGQDRHGVLMQVGTLKGCGMPYDKMHESSCRVYSPEGLSPTVNTCGGGNLEPKVLVKEPTVVIDDTQGFDGARYYNNEIPTLRSERSGLKVIVKEATKQGFALAYEGDSINIQFPDSKTRRDRVGQGVAQTIETSCNQATLTANYRIRKLTPLECFRLMDFDDADWQVLVDNGISDSQLYKMAGNSIVVRVLEKIMENLFMDNVVSYTKQLELFG